MNERAASKKIVNHREHRVTQGKPVYPVLPVPVFFGGGRPVDTQ